MERDQMLVTAALCVAFFTAGFVVGSGLFGVPVASDDALPLGLQPPANSLSPDQIQEYLDALTEIERQMEEMKALQAQLISFGERIERCDQFMDEIAQLREEAKGIAPDPVHIPTELFTFLVEKEIQYPDERKDADLVAGEWQTLWDQLNVFCWDFRTQSWDLGREAPDLIGARFDLMEQARQGLPLTYELKEEVQLNRERLDRLKDMLAQVS